MPTYQIWNQRRYPFVGNPLELSETHRFRLSTSYFLPLSFFYSPMLLKKSASSPLTAAEWVLGHHQGQFSLVTETKGVAFIVSTTSNKHRANQNVLVTEQRV